MSKFKNSAIGLGLLALTALLAWACGGGSGGGGSTTTRLKIEMVYPEQNEGRGKFAVIDENTPFIIGTDLGDAGGIPEHATHAVAEFYQEGRLVAEGSAELYRYATDPGLVARESRQVTISGVPTNKLLDLNLTLGRNDLSVTNPDVSVDVKGREDLDKIFYTGSVNNVMIVGSNVLLNGQEAATLNVEMGYITDGVNYGLQFYGDFSSMPIMADNVYSFIVPEEEIGQPSVISINSLVDFDSSSPKATVPQVTSGNVFDYQAMFFEVPEISRELAPYQFIFDSGNQLIDGTDFNSFILSSIVTEEQLISGNVLLVDFQTTVSEALTRVHENSEDLATGNITSVVAELDKVYEHLGPLFAANSGSLMVRVEDLALLEVIGVLANLCNTNQKTVFISPERLDGAISGLEGSSSASGLQRLYFEKGGGPLRVVDSSDKLLMVIPYAVDDTVVAQSGNIYDPIVHSSTNILSILYEEKVGPYLVRDAIWSYIYTITDLGSVGPIPEDSEE